jgi:TRAP transporter 4TM/12TM fusion protein
MRSLDAMLRIARPAVRAVLFVLIGGWILDVPGMLGTAYYNEQFLALAVGLATALVLLDEGGRRSVSWRLLNVWFAVVTLALFVYVAVHYPSLQLDLVMAPPEAVVLGIVMIAGVLEATRRKTGPFLPILLLVLMAFAFVGPHLPDIFQTRPVSFARLIVYLGLDTNALFGKVITIAVVVVAPFIVFGYLLNSFGGSTFFSGMAAAAVGRYKGGPAKVSVAGSAAFGMVSGSAVANVVAVGSVSIPMMVRAGYARHVAAAIEAVSSTGGQLMPPIMGASAFLMAELLELPYRTIVVAAILPSLFYYVALFLSVDFEARRLGIETDPADTLTVGGGDVDWLRGWRFLIPVAILLYLLFVENWTPEMAGVYSVGALVVVYLAFPLRGLRARIRLTGEAILGAMAAVSDIIMIGATAGLIIGVLNLTGISFAITLQMLAVSGGSLALLLLLTAGLSILLGLGMPTVGVYILLATLAAPALVKLGIQPLAAHMYVLYFGMLSMITPPIAIASFAAAMVGKADPWRTAFSSIRVGAAAYLIPVAFVLQPELLFAGEFSATLFPALRLALSIALLAAVTVGHVGRPLGVPLRILGGALSVANALPSSGSGGEIVVWLCFAAGIGVMVHAVRKPKPLTMTAPRAVQSRRWM